MPPKAEAPLRSAPRAPGSARERPSPGPVLLLAALLALGAFPSRPAAGEPDPLLEGSPGDRRPRVALVAAGPEFPIVGSQGVQPQLAGYLDLPRSLQLGLKARLDLREAREDYDYIPQVGLHLRQLWLSDEDTSTVRNSEYISLVLGGYPAYDFKGDRAGIKPMGAVAMGKYWMPFDNQPFGLDFCLEIIRYFDGHPPNKVRNHFLTAGVNLFYSIKR